MELLVAFLPVQIVEETSIRLRSTNRLPPIIVCPYPALSVEVPYEEKDIDYFCPNVTKGEFRGCIDGLFRDLGRSLGGIKNSKRPGEGLNVQEW